ncbi:hypothetical protein CRUP_034467 [Coryphaenoides rupestris]|nr:hypothetical protein CRUP_034467 [Coryphaenoides rupestris]
MVVLSIAGPMAAATASTSPTPWTWCAQSAGQCTIAPRIHRLWVEGRSSVLETFRQLLAEEGPRGMTKGLSARVISAMPTSVLIVVGYETLKRLSLRADLVESRHW